MKKFRKLFLVLFVVFFSLNSEINAASKCDYNKQAELNNSVANIKVSYEEAKIKVIKDEMSSSDFGEMPDDTKDIFKLSFYNLTEDFYLKITNDYNDEVKYINYYESESGVATYDWENLEAITNFKIVVYSSNNSGCPNEEYRVIYLTTPRINPFAYEAGCTGNEDFYLCGKYITETEELSWDEFHTKLEKFTNNKKTTEKEEKEKLENFWYDVIINFINDNKVSVLIISTIILVGGVVTTVVVIKKRRSRLI